MLTNSVSSPRPVPLAALLFQILCVFSLTFGLGQMRDCRVSSILTQNNFNLSLYAGKWHLISDYNTEGKVFFQVAQPQDIMADFRVLGDGTLEMKTGADLSFFGSQWLRWCFAGTGVGKFNDPKDKAKMTIQYKTAIPLSPASWSKPYWVISTDYHYALLYSCWQEREDGTCHPDKTFAWTLNRRRHGHTQKQQYHISMAATRACLNTSKFTKRLTKKICKPV